MKEISEYDHHISREGKPYQPMHQAMYKVIAELLRDKPATILEVGFGIGYGLDLFCEANCISKYLGIEPDTMCCSHVLRKLIKTNYDDTKILLMNSDWLSFPETALFSADFSLCIEVIEHISEIDLLPFLEKLYRYTKKALFLSTPDRNTDEHGIYTRATITAALKTVGFSEVVDIEWQKPHTLFIANP